MTSKRRSRAKWRLALTALVMVALAAYWLWPDSSPPPTPLANPPSSASHDEPPADQSNPIPPATADAGSRHQPVQTAVEPPMPLSPRGLAKHEPVTPQPQTQQPIDDPTPTSEPLADTQTQNQTAFAALPHTADESTLVASDKLLAPNRLIEQGQLVAARRLLNASLADPATPASERHTLRRRLAQINDTLVFSPRVMEDDELTESYTIQSGDLLSTIAPRFNISYQLIEMINDITARRIRVGQTIKIIKGPFHAVVHKSDYRMDMFLKGTGGQPVYIRSFEVGLGQDNSTPEGSWIVRRGGRVANPGWTNPRTGKVYTPNDPLNPIGEYWIGLRGNDEHTRGLVGYGVHGTIEPDSIGRQVSMGCVRLRPADIAMVYKLLTNGQSTVEVRP